MKENTDYAPAETFDREMQFQSGGFSEMLDATQRYYVVGGKGGVGKTSMAAALAVKFANQGEPTLIVSTNPTRSLGDSFEQVYEGLPCAHAT